MNIKKNKLKSFDFYVNFNADNHCEERNKLVIYLGYMKILIKLGNCLKLGLGSLQKGTGLIVEGSVF